MEKMKIEIYEEKEVVEIVRLKLKVFDDDYVVLMAVNEDGSVRKAILRIHSDGILRYTSCGGLGLPVDDDGRVILDE